MSIVEGHHVAVGIGTSARFTNRSPRQPWYVQQAPSTDRRRTVKPARAVVSTGERGIEIYTGPLAVLVARGYVTTIGEPCVAIQTVTG